MLHEFLSVLDQYFLSPVGLVALLGLIPLIIFYLVRPKPEEMIMPSIRFFMENRDSGRIKSAIERLLQNLMLLVHILFIAGIAAAIANPYIMAHETPEETVIVLDRSASMSNNWRQAKSFVRSNLGETNTLVVVDNDVTVPLERVSASRVRSYISGMEVEEVRTDIASGLETAQAYQGSLIVASDLDQTISNTDAAAMLDSMSARRDVRTLRVTEENSWGIVGMEPGRNTSIDIENFQDENVTVTVTKNQASIELEIPPEEVRTINFRTDPGMNTVKLESDGFAPDNTGYVSIPRDRTFKTVIIGENRYLEKATSLINFTSVETVTPPTNLPDADIYVAVSSNILPNTVNEIEQNVREGDSLVIFNTAPLDQFDSLPVKITGDGVDADVEFQEPRRVSIGDTRMLQANVTAGDSLSEPDSALVKADYGSGEVVFYNIDDRDFQTDFLYPVFWKEMYAELVERPSIGELNRKTGERLDVLSASGVSELDRTGFHNASNGVYAANLLDRDESFSEEASTYSGREAGESPQSVRNWFAAALILLALIETGYLYYTGDLK